MVKEIKTPKVINIQKMTAPTVIPKNASIVKDGSIQQLQYVSGPPLLMKSAMDAVKQWR